MCIHYFLIKRKKLFRRRNTCRFSTLNTQIPCCQDKSSNNQRIKTTIFLLSNYRNLHNRKIKQKAPIRRERILIPLCIIKNGVFNDYHLSDYHLPPFETNRKNENPTPNWNKEATYRTIGSLRQRRIASERKRSYLLEISITGASVHLIILVIRLIPIPKVFRLNYNRIGGLNANGANVDGLICRLYSSVRHGCYASPRDAFLLRWLL